MRARRFVGYRASRAPTLLLKSTTLRARADTLQQASYRRREPPSVHVLLFVRADLLRKIQPRPTPSMSKTNLQRLLPTPILLSSELEPQATVNFRSCTINS